MGDEHEFGIRGFRYRVHQITEEFRIVIVKQRVDFAEHRTKC